MTKQNQIFHKIVSLVLATSLAAGCATRGHYYSSPADISTADLNEINLGQQIHASIISKMAVYEEQKLVEYVQEIGHSLLPYVKRRHLPYQFIILRDDRIYATSAPGGYVYVTTGFISFIDNEAELAAILAQELGGLQFKDKRFSLATHAMEQLIQVAAMIAPAFGMIGALAIIGLVGVHATVTGEPRRGSRLLKVDELAIGYMTKAGFDPQGMVDLFRKILNASSKDLMYLYDYQQSRPVTKPRLEKLEKKFAKLSLENRAFTTSREQFLAATQSIRRPSS